MSRISTEGTCFTFHALPRVGLDGTNQRYTHLETRWMTLREREKSKAQSGYLILYKKHDIVLVIQWYCMKTSNMHSIVYMNYKAPNMLA